MEDSAVACSGSQPLTLPEENEVFMLAELALLACSIITIQKLSDRVEALNSGEIHIDEFEDWFLAESWGSYDIIGGDLSSALAAVHHVLYSLDSGELDEQSAPREMATAIRPFIHPENVVHLSLGPRWYGNT